MKRYRFTMLMVAVGFVANCHQAWAAKSTPPNIVIILADDMGYGDVHAFNPESKIPTPHLDRLAADGATFTDAHSGSAVCTPTRYGVVTGRYCWRTRLKRGVLNGYSKHLIDPARETIASMLKQRGYHTACIGKWHLGMDLPMAGKNEVDYAGTIKNGPTANGFDYFYGITASLDFPPYVFIENDRCTEAATEVQPKGSFPAYLRKGPVGKNFKHIEALDQLTEKSTAYIHEQAKAPEPFFLYFALTSPHKPVMPAPRFQGKSGLGPYGDFVMQTDWTVGQVLQALEESDAAKNTVVFYTSDNASFMYRLEGETAHVDNPSIQGFNPDNHRANYIYRGTKTDAWEGGHRVPFLVRWPGTIKPGSQSATPICLTDLMATCAEISGAPMPQGAGEDSYSILPMALGDPDAKRGAFVVNHSINGTFAIRDGKWKLILSSGSGGRGKPKSKPGDRPYQLYDIHADPAETTNLIEQHPEIAARLERAMEELKK